MKLLITEQDIRHIRGLYNLIMEDITSESGGTVKLFNYYKPGYYTLESIDTKTNQPVVNSLEIELDKVREFIKNHPDSIVSIKFISGESAIPNKDNEGKEGGKFLNYGDLSKLRKKYLDQYLQRYFQNLKTQKFISMDFELPPIQYEEISPKTSWVGTSFCPTNSTIEQQRGVCVNNYRDGVKSKNSEILKFKDLYNKEQFSMIEITVKLNDPSKKCLDNMTIEVNYTDLTKSHICNSAIYEIYIKGNLSKTDGMLLLRDDGKNYASLNNEFKDAAFIYVDSKLKSYDNDPKNYGGKRFNKFIITPEIASTLISDGSTSFIISAKCKNPYKNKEHNGGCHDGIGNIMITNGNGEKFPYNSVTPKGKDEVKILLTIDACGNLVKK